MTTTIADPCEARTEVQRLAAELALSQRKLAGIQEIGQVLAGVQDLDRVLIEIIKRTTALMEADRATLYLLSDDGRSLWSKSTHGGTVQTIELAVGQGIAGWVARYQRPVNVKDAYRDKRFDPAVDRASGYRTRSILCQPLQDMQGCSVGVIQVLNKRDGYFTTADEGLLRAIAGQAAVSIRNSKLYLDVVTKNIDLLDTQLKLKERTEEIEFLFQVERAAATARTQDEALDGMLAAAVAEFPCEAAAVLLYDDRRDRLAVDRVAGPCSGSLSGQLATLGDTLIGDVFYGGAAQSLRPSCEDRLGIGLPDGVELNTGACLAIRHQDAHLGCVLLVNRTKDPRGFDARDLGILEVIAHRMALSITLARAIEEDRKAERLAAIGKTLSSVVHDLKTPLTIIGGYARLMAREADADTRQEHRGLIQKQIGQVKQMIQELLAFSRGESEVLLRKVYIKEFIGEIRELLAEELAGSGVELAIDLRYAGAVRMDDGKMKRVVFNLARNAREAMAEQPHGRFTITVEERDDEVAFAFADSGPGIPAEMEGRLFDSFATFGKKNGTGLGLAIVKAIVDEHKGSLAVDSRPGEGTTFTIGLPKG
ncbi:MAG: histidine kinase [Proteobacteria bacterium]|nr:MAG: histidine kinase [Pseudomonadota bacterium]